MRILIAGRTLELHQGDISLQEVDAVVNAANRQLAGGGGVDGAIHRRGGPAIMAETRARYPDGCPTGSAVVSTAGELSASIVIHAVGPVWQGGLSGEPELLSSAYQRSLQHATEQQCRTVALPALSTGAYGYPFDEASRIALATSMAHLELNDLPSLVRFVLFDAGAYGAFARTLEELTRDD